MDYFKPEPLLRKCAFAYDIVADPEDRSCAAHAWVVTGSATSGSEPPYTAGRTQLGTQLLD